MLFKIKNAASFLVLFLLFTGNLPQISGQSVPVEVSFEKVQLMIPKEEKTREENVRLRFLENELQIETIAGAKVLKTFKYSEIKTAEYSYSKSPRWKTGLGLGAASILFPPLLLVAIPLGFTKHRRHWLTFQSDTDYAVLKLSKDNRKFIIPTFETKTGVKVSANGESK